MQAKKCFVFVEICFWLERDRIEKRSRRDFRLEPQSDLSTSDHLSMLSSHFRLQSIPSDLYSDHLSMLSFIFGSNPSFPSASDFNLRNAMTISDLPPGYSASLLVFAGALLLPSLFYAFILLLLFCRWRFGHRRASAEGMENDEANDFGDRSKKQ